MLSKLWPEAFASRCAFSKLPQPSPVDVLSACNVATGTPVAAEILSTLSACATAPNSRTKAAIITVSLFIGDYSFNGSLRVQTVVPSHITIIWDAAIRNLTSTTLFGAYWCKCWAVQFPEVIGRGG